MYYVINHLGHRYGLRASTWTEAARKALSIWPRRWIQRIERAGS